MKEKEVTRHGDWYVATARGKHGWVSWAKLGPITADDPIAEPGQNVWFNFGDTRTEARENILAELHLPGATSLVIVGPQGCGKTRFAQALAKHYGLDRIVESERFSREYLAKAPTGTLFLAQAQPELTDLDPWRVIAFDDAMHAAGLRADQPPPPAVNSPRRDTGD